MKTPLVLIAVLSLLLTGCSSGPDYREFTKCLKGRDVKFYGAFWCSHCKNQKTLFGSAEKYLPYIECSTPDGRGVLPICKENKIEGYPTWVFPDGTRLSGERKLEDLATQSGCDLPK